MEDNKYLFKYLKYKQKYLTAKNQIGGAFAFDNTAFFYIMAVITGNTLDRVNQRRTILGLTGSAVLHLTLLHLHVNLDNPAHVILVDPKFIELIGSAFQKYIKKPNVKLESILQNQSGKIMGGVWEFLGQPSFDSKFWARIYSLPHEFTENYSNFRREIYGYINSKLGVSTMYHREEQKGSGTDIQTFEIFYTPDHHRHSEWQSHAEKRFLEPQPLL